MRHPLEYGTAGAPGKAGRVRPAVCQVSAKNSWGDSVRCAPPSPRWAVRERPGGPATARSRTKRSVAIIRSVPQWSVRDSSRMTSLSFVR